MSLISLIKIASKSIDAPFIMELSPEQKNNLKLGKVILVLENKEFLPRIFALGLKVPKELDDIKEEDLIFRNITDALNLAGHNLELIRGRLRCNNG